jgi:hypothetical protein
MRYISFWSLSPGKTGKHFILGIPNIKGPTVVTVGGRPEWVSLAYGMWATFWPW